MLIYANKKSSSTSAHKIMLVFRIFIMILFSPLGNILSLSLVSEILLILFFIFLFPKEMHKSILDFFQIIL